MRKTFLIAAAAVLSIVACQKEMPVAPEGNYTVRASRESAAGTKSTVSDDGAFAWSAGDAIGLWNGKKFCELTTSTGGSATADFTGTMEGTAQSYAVYPFALNAKVESGNVKVTLPASYEWKAGETNSPMLAECGENPSSLKFKHLGGLVKVSVKNVPAEAAKFVLTADKDIAGEYSVSEDAEGNKIIKSAETAENNSVAFTFTASTATAMAFYVPVPVGDYKFTVALQKADGTQLWSYGGASVNSVTRAKFIIMPELTIANIPGTGEDAKTSVTIPANYSGEFALPNTTSDVEVKVEANSLPITVVYGGMSHPGKVSFVGSSSELGDLVINLPDSHVELNGLTVNNVTSTTSGNTLVVGKDVTIKTSLKIEKGTAEIYGNVAKIEKGIDAGTVTWYAETAKSIIDAILYSDRVVLNNDIDLEDKGLTIEGGKQLTLDLNGHKLNAKSSVVSIRHAKVDITGKGEIAETEDNQYGALLLSGAKEDVAEYTVVNIGKDVTLKGWSGIFVAKDDNGEYNNYGLIVNCSAKIERQEGFVKDCYGLYINGQNNRTSGNVATFNLDGCNIGVSGAGIYAAGYANWNIKNCDISAENAAIEFRAGKMTIDGGKYEATKDPLTVEPNGNGTTVAGAALGVSQHTTNLPIDVAVKSGTFKGAYSIWEKDVQNEVARDVIKLTVENGTFNGPVYSQNNSSFIKGGTFSDPSALNYLSNDADVTVLVAKGTYKNVFKATAGKALVKPAVSGEEVIIGGIDAQSNNSTADFAFENITFDNSIQDKGWFVGTAQNIYPCVGVWGGTYSFKNCKFIVDGGSGKETGIMTWWTVKDCPVKLSFDACSFEGKDNASAARAMQIYDHVNLDVTNCTLSTVYRYAIKYAGNEGYTANIKNNNVSNCLYMVELGSSEYPGSKYIVNFKNNILGKGIADYKVANEEGATINGGTKKE